MPYPAKLLLFGEYLLLAGEPALTVPLPAFFGEWIRSENPNDAHAAALRAFSQSEMLATMSELDVAAFQQDLENGWQFQSNIPVGYGLGSSGALCAGVYDRYRRGPAPSDLPELKNRLARMEGFFHGNSSGIDPLTSLLKKPLFLSGSGAIEPLPDLPWLQPDAAADNRPRVLLLDSQTPRRTAPLVQWFSNNLHDEAFVKAMKRYLVPAHRTLVQSWLQTDARAFWPALKAVSGWQFHNMAPMVPPAVRDTWQQGLASDGFYLKICGSGGGGFVLCFARTDATAAEITAHFPAVFPFGDLP